MKDTLEKYQEITFIEGLVLDLRIEEGVEIKYFYCEINK